MLWENPGCHHHKLIFKNISVHEKEITISSTEQWETRADWTRKYQWGQCACISKGWSITSICRWHLPHVSPWSLLYFILNKKSWNDKRKTRNKCSKQEVCPVSDVNLSGCWWVFWVWSLYSLATCQYTGACPRWQKAVPTGELHLSSVLCFSFTALWHHPLSLFTYLMSSFCLSFFFQPAYKTMFFTRVGIIAQIAKFMSFLILLNKVSPNRVASKNNPDPDSALWVTDWEKGVARQVSEQLLKTWL